MDEQRINRLPLYRYQVVCDSLVMLEEAINKKITENHTVLFIIISINNLPFLTDIYGVNYIEKLLEILENDLVSKFPESRFSHISYDKFAMTTKELKEHEIIAYVNNISKTIQFFGAAPIIENHIHIEYAMGCTKIKDNDNYADIINRAYLALNNVCKEDGESFSFYEHAKNKKEQYKSKLQAAELLKKTILTNHFRLAFQPVINSATGNPDYYECLLRIVQDDSKLTSIGPYIGVAEELGLIKEIDTMVLDMVIEELRHNPDITLSFNVSSISIHNEGWISKAKDLFKNPDLASRAIIEITETAFQRDLGKVAYFIANLQDAGCLVALDDFGSGYTSFKQLRALPVDIIKIDGAFIRDIVNNSESRLFVKTLLTISKNIGLKSVAEFVENGEIAKLLMELKLDYMQGNYFSPASNYRFWNQDNL